MAKHKPYDDHGRFVSISCPRIECGGGKLVNEDDGIWRCNGLAEPDGCTPGELVDCWYHHLDGKPKERATATGEGVCDAINDQMAIHLVTELNQKALSPLRSGSGGETTLVYGKM